MIQAIPITAPLWKGATEGELRKILQHMSNASYHYADDSTREWGRASLEKMQAASEVNRLGLGFTAIKALFEEAPQLFTLDAFMDAVLKDARK